MLGCDGKLGRQAPWAWPSVAFDLNGCEARVWRGCGAGCRADLRRATLNRQLLFWAARERRSVMEAPKLSPRSGWAKSPTAPVSAIGPRQIYHLWMPLLTGLCLAACCFVVCLEMGLPAED